MRCVQTQWTTAGNLLPLCLATMFSQSSTKFCFVWRSNTYFSVCWLILCLAIWSMLKTRNCSFLCKWANLEIQQRIKNWFPLPVWCLRKLFHFNIPCVLCLHHISSFIIWHTFSLKNWPDIFGTITIFSKMWIRFKQCFSA